MARLLLQFSMIVTCVGGVPGVLNSYGLFGVSTETALTNFIGLVVQFALELSGFEDVAAASWERIKEGQGRAQVAVVTEA